MADTLIGSWQYSRYSAFYGAWAVNTSAEQEIFAGATTLYIHKIDGGTIDRSTTLAAITTGDKIKMTTVDGSQAIFTIQTVATLTGDIYSWTIVPCCVVGTFTDTEVTNIYETESATVNGVITVNEAKLLLGITDTSKDVLISFLIPVIENDINEYCNTSYTYGTWPVWMKLPASKMIGFNLDSSTSNGMKSESQGGYSYTRAEMSGGYPIGIMHPFDRARIASVGRQSVKTQFRDMRGWNSEELVKLTPPEGVDE